MVFLINTGIYKFNVGDDWVLDPALVKSTALKLLDSVLNIEVDGRNICEPFMDLVSKEEYPDYYQIIANPICFNIITSRINSLYYHDMLEFKNDVLLMFSNCKIYNAPDSWIYLDANHLEVFMKMLSALFSNE